MAFKLLRVLNAILSIATARMPKAMYHITMSASLQVRVVIEPIYRYRYRYRLSVPDASGHGRSRRNDGRERHHWNVDNTHPTPVAMVMAV